MFKNNPENEDAVGEGHSIAEVSKYCMATDLGLECVCSKRSTVTIGTGATSKKEDSTLYYYAKQIDDDLLALQSLNANWAPSGPAAEVTMDELITQYQPEVDMFLKQVKPVIQKIAKAVARGTGIAGTASPIRRPWNTTTPWAWTKRTCAPCSASG